MHADNPHPIDITVYQPDPRDGEIENPLLREVRDIIDRFSGGGMEKARMMLSFERDSLKSRYAFAIPTAESLERIARHSPLVEIAAGSGYWAMCLAAYGADIIAYDLFPPGEADITDISGRNWLFRKTFHTVRKGDETIAAQHPDRSLFLCWPPPDSPVAFRALESYLSAGGKTAIVIGHMKPISMGDPSFYQLLGTLPVIERIPIHGWPGLNEELFICGG
ncbi:MAG: hypothetical protein JXA07_15075 [Spirochaetes bacterium]|nr:hypothetical protein [Spirochaetota bacterium]